MTYRKAYHEELDQLRMQVELMGVVVDRNLERMREVIAMGDASVAAEAVAADDGIDAMNVSLTERCYELLLRESPVADDLRFIVSVMRILSELERIGDLSLRVVKVQPDRAVIREQSPEVFDILVSMVDVALDCYRTALRAWSAQDLQLATDLSARTHSMDMHYERFTSELLTLRGPNAVRIATGALIAGRALERIADHATIMGARLRYMLTGDPSHLTAEVR